MAINTNVIILWNGSDGDIPTGWERKSELDGKYLKGISGSGIDPGTIGGGTHTHISPAHTHIQNSHNHTTSCTKSGSSDYKNYDTSGTGVLPSHSHTTTADSTTATNQTTSVILDNALAEPSYYTMIALKSLGTDNIPDLGIVYYAEITPPDGFYICDGNNSTPNLTNKFIKIAPISGSAGIMGDGLHTHSNATHTHIQDSHSHYVNVGDGGTTTRASGTEISGTYRQHSSGDGSSSGAIPVNNSSSVTVSTDSYEPPFKKLITIQNRSGMSKLPVGAICMWSGSLVNIPSGWKLCDGNNGTLDLTDLFVKVTNTENEIGNTGGSLTHKHTSLAHTHSQSSHAHSRTLSHTSPGTANQGNNYVTASAGSHTHSVTLSSATATNQDTTVTFDDCADSRPDYYEVAYIQYVGGGRKAQTIIIL